MRDDGPTPDADSDPGPADPDPADPDPADPGPESSNPEAVDERRGLAGRMVRAARDERGLSQRELAALAGVPRASVGRIEAEEVSPRVDTLLKVLAAAGFSIGLLDHRGRPLELDPTRDVIRDRAGRHLPSHLRPVPTPRYMGPIEDGDWWGWHHVAWPGVRDRVPTHTYWKRPPPPPVVGHNRDGFRSAVWDDAT